MIMCEKSPVSFAPKPQIVLTLCILVNVSCHCLQVRLVKMVNEATANIPGWDPLSST